MDKVTVTQADREAAASIAEWQRDTGWEPCFFHHDFPRGVREGAWDNHDLVGLLARHREQSIAPYREALEKISKITAFGYPAREIARTTLQQGAK